MYLEIFGTKIMKSKTITREEFYNLVWTKPVSHVAKEYGYSDMGIRKICKKHNIPLPKLGYWSKLKYCPEIRGYLFRTKMFQLLFFCLLVVYPK